MSNITHKCFKPTQDDWYGSYAFPGWYAGTKGHLLVEVSFHIYPTSSNNTAARVSVWGNDDTGMDKDFVLVEEAALCFQKLLLLNFVNKVALTHMGFKKC